MAWRATTVSGVIVHQEDGSVINTLALPACVLKDEDKALLVVAYEVNM